uniref:HMG box domain-containing protein n=1 Tax=Anopheles epiroticus TaxID=199890 RepID=A0A182P7Y8_9DIPT
MTPYAYFVQATRQELKEKNPEEHVMFVDFSKQCAEKWKKMRLEEKQRFHEMAVKDKSRYELEMQRYVQPHQSELARNKKRNRNKKQKDPNAPKRPVPVFIWFCEQERNNVRTLHPKYNAADIAKVLSRQWTLMETEEKQKYREMAEKDMARFEKEMIEYKLKCNQQANITLDLHMAQHVQQMVAAAQPKDQVFPVQQTAAVACEIRQP